MDIDKLIMQLIGESIIKGTLSQPKFKTYDYQKTLIHRIEEDRNYYQFESFTKEQAFHKNIELNALESELKDIISNYKQLHIYTSRKEYMIRISKKGKLHITSKAQSAPLAARKHNTDKNHILQDGQPVDFLIHLGIMDANGKVKHKWYDKFKQINRYLELIEDSLKYIENKEPTIIDFGCGKSYLTFALYYYLVKIKGLKVTIIGLDLKEKVIEDLQMLTKELNYEGLDFRVGDIAMFDYEFPIDMVISLHACNLATDYALEKAVKWKAKVIMAVPCCHKELNGQIKIDAMEAVMQYGVLKERIAALMTDGLRAELLKAKGYETQVMEFVDMEHTPKNLMIRGVLKGEAQEKPSQAYYRCIDEYGLRPTLEQLLFKDNS
jgi:SAM-dependent methyltransferase